MITIFYIPSTVLSLLKTASFVFRVTEARNLPRKIEPSEVKIDKDYYSVYKRNVSKKFFVPK